MQWHDTDFAYSLFFELGKNPGAADVVACEASYATIWHDRVSMQELGIAACLLFNRHFG